MVSNRAIDQYAQLFSTGQLINCSIGYHNRQSDLYAELTAHREKPISFTGVKAANTRALEMYTLHEVICPLVCMSYILYYTKSDIININNVPHYMHQCMLQGKHGQPMRPPLWFFTIGKALALQCSPVHHITQADIPKGVHSFRYIPYAIYFVTCSYINA